jgi:hypothetical protein
VLLTLALGFTAAAHAAAFLLAILLALIVMEYLAKGHRAFILPILFMATLGALVVVFASYAFEPDAFSYYFRSGAGRLWLSLAAVRPWFLSLPNAAVTIAALLALVLYIAIHRSRYFGNTLPLLMTVLLFLLVTPGAQSNPALWALPFLYGFVAGVFADILETRRRRLFLWTAGSLLLLQAMLSLVSLSSLSA